MSKEFWVDNYNLNSIDNFTIRSTKVYEMPDIRLRSSDKVLADGAVTTSSNLSARTIAVKGDIISTERSTLDDTMQKLMSKAYKTEVVLKCKYGTSNKNFTGSLSNLRSDDAVGGYTDVILLFECSDPYAYAETLSTASSVNKTTSTFNTSCISNGYANTPVNVTITVDSVTANASDTITIAGYNTTMTISRTYTAGDVIDIDSTNLSVKVNGVETNFAGQFPVLQGDTSTNIAYTDTFTARQVDVDCDWYDRWH